jgi:UrcA family protein
MQPTRHLGPVAAALLALGATFGGAAATEAAPANTRSAAVEYADLELGNGLAVDKLYARIAAAAEQVCGAYEARDLRARADWRACYEAAVSDAVARVPHAALAERHRAKRARSDVTTRVPVG